MFCGLSKVSDTLREWVFISQGISIITNSEFCKLGRLASQRTGTDRDVGSVWKANIEEVILRFESVICAMLSRL